MSSRTIMHQRTNRLPWIAMGACLIFPLSCALRTSDTFRVLPSTPQYEVQSPDLTRTAYDQVIQQYTPHGRGWVELKPKMGIFIQNAIFREGSVERGIEDFVGTEAIHYAVEENGSLQQVDQVIHVDPRPRAIPPVERLISLAQRQRKYHRLFYQALIRPTDTHRVPVLVSADSPEQLKSLTEGLLSEAKIPGQIAPPDYTVFPESASVAAEITVTVDRSPVRVIWGSRLSKVIAGSPNPKLFRLYKGQWRKVDFDPGDRTALSVPLLPGDRIER